MGIIEILQELQNDVVSRRNQLKISDDVLSYVLQGEQIIIDVLLDKLKKGAIESLDIF